MHCKILFSRLSVAVLSLLVPAWLLLTGVRLMMTDQYLRLEYGKGDFPVDTYGFSQADRLEYAPFAVGYLLNAEGIDYLGGLSFPDGSPMYNERELEHMADVKAVVQVALFVYGVLSVILALGLLVCFFDLTTRSIFRAALMNGAWLTLALIMGIAALAVLSWDTFFEFFHRLFFEEGTWRFYYSDTLIRLFPEKFWFDTALSIGAIAVVGAVLILASFRLWSRRSRTG